MKTVLSVWLSAGNGCLDKTVREAEDYDGAAIYIPTIFVLNDKHISDHMLYISLRLVSVRIITSCAMG